MATYRLDGNDFEALVRRGLGNPSTDEISAAQIMQYVNLAQLELVATRPEDFPHLLETEDITTVADQAEYDLTDTDIVKVLFLSSSTMPRLKRKDLDYAKRIGDTASVNPWAWYPAGDDDESSDTEWVIGLIGTPSSSGETVTVHYVKAPREIVITPASAVNTSGLPQSYDLVIVKNAIGLGLELNGRFDDAQKYGKQLGASEARARRSDPGGIEHSWRIGGSMSDLKVG